MTYKLKKIKFLLITLRLKKIITFYRKSSLCRSACAWYRVIQGSCIRKGDVDFIEIYKRKKMRVLAMLLISEPVLSNREDECMKIFNWRFCKIWVVNVRDSLLYFLNLLNSNYNLCEKTVIFRRYLHCDTNISIWKDISSCFGNIF